MSTPLRSWRGVACRAIGSPTNSGQASRISRCCHCCAKPLSVSTARTTSPIGTTFSGDGGLVRSIRNRSRCSSHAPRLYRTLAMFVTLIPRIEKWKLLRAAAGAGRDAGPAVREFVFTGTGPRGRLYALLGLVVFFNPRSIAKAESRHFHNGGTRNFTETIHLAILSCAMTEKRSPELLVARLPAKSELLYDADCSLCARWAKRWQWFAGPAVTLRPLQDAARDYPELRDTLLTAIHLVEPNGRVTRAAEAILRSLAIGRKIHWPLRCYERCPLWRRLSESLYASLAAHRCRSAPSRDA